MANSREKISQEKCLFCKLVAGEIPSYPIYEDEKFMAVLSPYPNMPGQTVVLPKAHITDYVFDMENHEINEYMAVIKKVAKRLDKKLDVMRTALIFEGTGVAHVHAKLYPLPGDLAGQTDVSVKGHVFYNEYPGFISTIDGPEMTPEELRKVQAQIKF